MNFSQLRFIFFVAFSVVVASLQAQQFYGGIIGGINACQVGGDDLGGYHKLGVAAGGFAGLQLTPMSGVRMELEYSIKGSRKTPPKFNDYNETQEVGDDFRIEAHCIDLPILYHFMLNRHFSFITGLSGSFIFAFRQENWGMGAGSQDYNFMNLNFVAGVIFSINRNWAVDFRTSNGITPMQSNNTSQRRMGFLPNGFYNDILTLSISYNFGKGAID
ncbi:MAG: PorT family protein [Bacteroidales bacterium]|jgi:hypothetical protein|nr:PorT family protein [Bacteroidales bacterium]